MKRLRLSLRTLVITAPLLVAAFGTLHHYGHLRFHTGLIFHLPDGNGVRPVSRYVATRLGNYQVIFNRRQFTIYRFTSWYWNDVERDIQGWVPQDFELVADRTWTGKQANMPHLPAF